MTDRFVKGEPSMHKEEFEQRSGDGGVQGT